MIINKFKKTFISVSTLIASTAIFQFVILKLWNIRWGIPVSYTGLDDFVTLSNAKTILDTGWIYNNPYLGAPFGTNNYDFLAIHLQNFDNLILKILLLLTNDISIAVNLQYILTFHLIALISYFVMKSLSINNLFSILGSITYAFLPFIFLRGILHLCLSTYQFIPLGILICIWLFTDDNFFIFNKRFFNYKRNRYALFFIIFIACNNISYYPFFTCFLLCITGLSKYLKKQGAHTFTKTASLIFCICLIMFICLSPALVYHMQEGPNKTVANRKTTDAELFGMKIAQLYIPTNPHGIDFLKRGIKYYNTRAPLVNENSMSYLGIVGITGFTILLLMLFKTDISKDKPFNEKIKLLSELNISAVLLATIGGFSSLFASLISPQIRAYNRISIFIAYLSILTICLLINQYQPKKKILYNLLITILFIACLFEQYPGNTPDYDTLEQAYTIDHEFIKKIESTVPQGAMIYQLPYHPFPESGFTNEMGDYHLLTGFLHSSSLKWSYGGMKGRQADAWNNMISSKSIDEMVKIISLTGFEGIYIDTRAYTEKELAKLESKLKEILQKNPIISQNKILEFFNLSDYKTSYLKKYSKKELKNIRKRILSFTRFRFGKGFAKIKKSKNKKIIYIDRAKSEININNYTNDYKVYPINIIASTLTKKSNNLLISFNDKSNSYIITNNGVEIRLKYSLKPGPNTIYFKTDAGGITAPGRHRKLFLKIEKYNFGNDDIILK